MRRHSRGVVAVACLLVLAVLAPAAAVAAPADAVGVTTTVSTATVEPGDAITVEATIDGDGVHGPLIDANVPDGWTVEAVDDDGGTYKSSTNEWLWLTAGDYTVTYTLTVPSTASAGEYTVENEGSGIYPSTSEYVADTDAVTVTVESTEAMTVREAVASYGDGDDSRVEDGEIQQAVNWWQTDAEVPNTGGQTIDDATIQQLVSDWVTGAEIGGN
ncbi:hypothetical protein [Haloarcula nitratireducens]|uniref:Uncharacterized protein n=1 Tax=Haloarcula nitratireducens TaxID=2487749 RepID=A0AAW4P952_9EURY|nr:hypothetical protein [Halomicroarcula nitratireducens]MBX0293817.1 hypothetical protein [Halomicroarcula nitratireducens]